MSDEKEMWFTPTPRWGRLAPVHWKGWAAFAALILAVVLGMALEDVLQSYGSPVLYYAVMVPLGAAVLALAWVMAGRIAS